MATLDTNCLLRWLVRDDPAKTAQVDALLVSGQHLRVPDVALIETVYVLEGHYRFSRAEVAQAIRLLIGQAGFDIDRARWVEIIDLYQSHPKLLCSDIFLALDARHHNEEPLITFDKKLVNQLRAVSPAVFTA